MMLRRDKKRLIGVRIRGSRLGGLRLDLHKEMWGIRNLFKSDQRTIICSISLEGIRVQDHNSNSNHSNLRAIINI